MIRALGRLRRRQILLDISTQRDFLLAEGSACIRNHRRVLANIRRMMAWARRGHMRVISTCQVYPNNNGGGEIDYCLEGTEGQEKVGYTLLENRASLPADGSTDMPIDILRHCRQIILYKRTEDPFAEPRIERLLSEVRADNFVLIGAEAEGAVKAAALGLLQRGRKVTVVTDAIGSHNKEDSEMAFRKMKAKGAKMVETKKLAGISHLKRVGVCHCDSCRRIEKEPGKARISA